MERTCFLEMGVGTSLIRSLITYSYFFSTSFFIDVWKLLILIQNFFCRNLLSQPRSLNGPLWTSLLAVTRAGLFLIWWDVERWKELWAFLSSWSFLTIKNKRSYNSSQLFLGFFFNLLSQNIDPPFYAVFEENPQFKYAPGYVRVKKMFEHIKSKLREPPSFFLCFLSERKNSDVYGNSQTLISHSWNMVYFFSSYEKSQKYCLIYKSLEKEKSCWIWNCDSVYCSSHKSSKWSVSHQCSPQDKCQGDHFLSIIVVSDIIILISTIYV